MRRWLFVEITNEATATFDTFVLRLTLRNRSITFKFVTFIDVFARLGYLGLEHVYRQDTGLWLLFGREKFVTAPFQSRAIWVGVIEERRRANMAQIAAKSDAACFFSCTVDKAVPAAPLQGCSVEE